MPEYISKGGAWVQKIQAKPPVIKKEPVIVKEPEKVVDKEVKKPITKSKPKRQIVKGVKNVKVRKQRR